MEVGESTNQETNTRYIYAKLEDQATLRLLHDDILKEVASKLSDKIAEALFPTALDAIIGTISDGTIRSMVLVEIGRRMEDFSKNEILKLLTEPSKAKESKDTKEPG